MSILLSIKHKCDFCDGATKHVYDPINSKRGVIVNLCLTCGLLQSISTKPYLSRPPGSMSSDADRSSYRYTKDVVSDRYIKVFNEFIDFSSIDNILDIGSNRGVFINWIHENYGKKNVTAIEPHPYIVKSYAGIDTIDLRNCRFEETKLKDGYYDFVHCIHTLEHAKSAKEMLKGTYDTLRENGIFFLAVPNTIFYSDLIEELFIDPHTFHFSYDMLKRFILNIGFSLIYSGESSESDIIFLLKKEKTGKFNYVNDALSKFKNFPIEVENNIILYRKKINENRSNLKKSISLLNEESKNMKVVVWGGGRIFNAMITFGDLSPDNVYLVIDKYLSLYVDEINGFTLNSPSVLFEEQNMDSIIVYIASRDYADEIRKEAESYGVKRFINFVSE